MSFSSARRFSFSLFVVCFILAAFSVPTYGLTKDLETLPTSVTVNGTQLQLNGWGIHTETFFRIRAYKAALYLARPATDANEVISSSAPKQLVIKFLRDVDAEDVQDVWRKGFAANSENAGAMHAQSESIAAMLPDMDEGQQLVITADEHGATIDLPGGVKRTVEGQEFSAAAFRIWLGAHAADTKVKSALLGQQ